jgi:GWxTD domain-containing protein
MRFGIAVLVTGASFAGCGGGGQAAPGQPVPDEVAGLAGPLETYAELGFVAGPGHFPAIAGFSMLAGPADSTFILFGMSLPNTALRFQRDPAGFMAEYNVVLSFMTPDSQLVERVSRRETVRVPSFQETGRTDESIVFQHIETLAPGTYLVGIEAGDANSSRGFRSVDTLAVPDYATPGLAITQPIVIYEGDGRAERGTAPELILNPRHTSAYGGDAPRVYVETYNATAPVPVTIRIDDEFGAEVWSARTAIAEGDSMLRRALIDLPSATLPLGKLFVEVEATDGRVATADLPIVISISDQWLITSFVDVLQFLQYIATRAELDSLSVGTPVERRDRWEAFWRKRDPVPATPVNEYRDEFFQRVRAAAEQFSEAGGQPGWRTDRGEVYIVLGPPGFVQERYLGRTEFVGRPNAWEWLYPNAPGGRLVLLFLDQNGFGHYELTSASESAFRGVAERLKQDPGG